MQTLLEFIPRIRALGSREAIRWSSSVRTQKASYEDLYGRIGACLSYLEDCGIRKCDRVLIWAENRIEWVALFWACVARGVHIVPVDFRFTPELVDRIRSDCGAKTVVDEAVLNNLAKRPTMHEFELTPAAADDIVEIIYTSGTTGEPKGVVHRHRNICANLGTFEREIAKYRQWARPFQPLRILDLLPLSHMFGQSMGLFIPVFLEGAVAFTSDMHPVSILRVA